MIVSGQTVASASVSCGRRIFLTSFERARFLQVELGHASDDAVPGVAEGAERRAECQEGGEAKEPASERGASWVRTLAWTGSGLKAQGSRLWQNLRVRSGKLLLEP